MKIAKAGYIALSLVFCALGVATAIIPEEALTVFGRTCGIVMMIFGCVKLVGYFSKDLYRLAFQFDLQFGLLLIPLGLIVTLKPENVISFLTIALGVIILTDGLFKIRIALDARRFGIRYWWVLFALSIVAGAIGPVLLFRPSESAKALLVLLGISFIADGLLNLFVSTSMVKIIDHQLPDRIREEIRDE